MSSNNDGERNYDRGDSGYVIYLKPWQVMMIFFALIVLALLSNYLPERPNFPF